MSKQDWGDLLHPVLDKVEELDDLPWGSVLLTDVMGYPVAAIKVAWYGGVFCWSTTTGEWDHTSLSLLETFTELKLIRKGSQ